MDEKDVTKYEELKIWLKNNKQPIILGVCYVLVFIVGFGTGRFEREIKRSGVNNQSNYSTKSAKTLSNQEQTQGPQGAVAGEATTTQLNLGAKTSADCPIKGNISSSGKKIYHIKGGAFYNIVKPEECFNTEGEAQAAGFVRSSR